VRLLFSIASSASFAVKLFFSSAGFASFAVKLYLFLRGLGDLCGEASGQFPTTGVEAS